MTRKMSIEGMACMNCVKHVTAALNAVSGVEDVKVDLGSKTASVEITAAVTDEMLKSAVEEAGYEVTEIN